MKQDESVESNLPSGEKDQLLTENPEQCEPDKRNVSKVQELALTLTLFGVQFLALCSDGIIFPFYPNVAVERGISNVLVGVVFSAYDITRFLSSPIFGSLVSLILANLKVICRYMVCCKSF